MLDIKFVRENPDIVDKSCESRQNAHWDREKFFELDEERRSVIAEVEKLQADRNSVSKQIGLLMKDGKKDEAEAAKAQVAANKERIAELGEKRTTVEQELFDLVAAIPNIPHESVPYGKDDSDNPEVRRWGTPRDFEAEGITMKPHWDLGTDLDILDFERGNKLSGSRFTVLGGAGARLERALINFFLDTHTSRGFKEWWPPIVVKRQTMFGTGQLPKFEDDAYHVSGDNFLIPTAEVVLTNLHAGEVLDADTLPRRYTAFTPCFREEAGSAGRDTRGIIRVHDDRTRDPSFSPWVKLHQDADHLDHFGTYDVWMCILECGANNLTLPRAAQKLMERNFEELPPKREELNYELSRRIFDERVACSQAFAARFAKESRGEIVGLDVLLREE